MGYKNIELKLPTGYSEKELKERIAKETGSRDVTWQIESKSLDARKKGNIHWLMRIAITSQDIKGDEPEHGSPLEISYAWRNKRVVITGSGPAGFFAAYVLRKPANSARWPITHLVKAGQEPSPTASSLPVPNTSLLNAIFLLMNI